MTTQYISLHITHGYVQFLSNKRAKTGCIQDAGHTNHPIARETADLIGQLRHGIQGVCDHNQDAVGRVVDHLLCYMCDNLLVFLDQVVAGHTRLAWETRCHHNNI